MDLLFHYRNMDILLIMQPCDVIICLIYIAVHVLFIYLSKDQRWRLAAGYNLTYLHEIGH